MSNQADEIKLKTVAYFSNSAEAGMVAELLENNGIQVVIQGGNFGGLEPLRIPGGYSEIRLGVAERDFARARELYQAFFSSQASFDHGEAEPAESAASPENEAPDEEALVVLTTTQTREDGQKLAQKVVELELAACVQVVVPITSIYRWQGQIETANEALLLIKTTRSAYANLATAIKELHQYQTPEILALPVAAGSADYLAWLRESVRVRN